MSDPILHHYMMSPYAEKIRLCLGYKGLRWSSVDTPIVLPKPDHIELTGGYRRVPVLQIGADIYCDTALITRELDRRFPTPPLFPLGQETLVHSVCQWAETTFMMVVVAFFGTGGVFPEEFVKDRRDTMIPPGQDIDSAGLVLPTKLLQIAANLDRLESMLGDGRDFLFGAEPNAADMSAYHPLLFLASQESTAALLEPRKSVGAWMKRVRAIGHGSSEAMDAGDAIAIAKAHEPESFAGEVVLPEGISIGDPVVVLPDEYGSGNVAGTLAASGLHEIAVRREGERAGTVVVHFPRETYAVLKTG